MPPIIAVTGTKGKTSVVRLLDHILSRHKYKTLRTDNDGVFYTGKLVHSKEDAQKVRGLKWLTRCPGRFLYLTKQKETDIAIFETAMGCAIQGLGYDRHQIGIFTNVYKEHIAEIKCTSSAQIAKFKASFLFRRINPTGYAIYKEDKNIMKNLKLLPEGTKTIVVTEKEATIPTSPSTYSIYVKNATIHIYKKTQKIYSCDTTHFPLTYGGLFKPNIMNIAYTLGGILALWGEKDFLEKKQTITQALMAYKSSLQGQRFILLKKQGKTIIVDYAHEEESLRSIGKFAQKVKAAKTNHTTIIFRITPSKDKTIERMQAFGKIMSSYFDTIYIYEKNQGDFEKQKVSKRLEAIKNGIKPRATFEAIPSGIDALQKSIHEAEKGDVIVFITHDGIHQHIISLLEKL